MVQLIAFTIIAPYISMAKYRSVFESQTRPVAPAWYSVFRGVVISGLVLTSCFQVLGVSGHIGVYELWVSRVLAFVHLRYWLTRISRMSLVDESMIPFQTAYVQILVCIVIILAGNTLYVCSFLSLLLQYIG